MHMSNYEEFMEALKKLESGYKEYESIIGGGFVGDSPAEENPKKEEQKISDEEWEKFCKEEGLVDG